MRLGSPDDSRRSAEDDGRHDVVFIHNVTVFLSAVSGFALNKQVASTSNEDGSGLLGLFDEETGRITLSSKEINKIHKRF